MSNFLIQLLIYFRYIRCFYVHIQYAEFFRQRNAGRFPCRYSFFLLFLSVFYFPSCFSPIIYFLIQVLNKYQDSNQDSLDKGKISFQIASGSELYLKIFLLSFLLTLIVSLSPGLILLLSRMAVASYVFPLT